MIDRLAAIDRTISARLTPHAAASKDAAWVVAVLRFSQTGSYGIGWVLLFAVVVTYLEGPLVAVLASACVLGMLLLNTGIKLLVRRPRPHNVVGERPTTYSFPSAHTSMAMVGASIMDVVEPDLLLLWWGWAVLLALSRIILGMHYIFDVAAGAVLGALIGIYVAVPLLVRAGAG